MDYLTEQIFLLILPFEAVRKIEDHLLFLYRQEHRLRRFSSRAIEEAYYDQQVRFHQYDNLLCDGHVSIQLNQLRSVYDLFYDPAPSMILETRVVPRMNAVSNSENVENESLK